MRVVIEFRPGSGSDSVPPDLFPTGAAAIAERGKHEVLRRDHYVDYVSTAPATKGEGQKLYLREVSPVDWCPSGGVVLCCHGGGFPSTMGYDTPYKDYSWMASLAESGVRAFSVDMIGYGLSTRPAAMDDPRNLSEADQSLLIPELLQSVSQPAFPYQLTTLQSEWDSIDSVVSYIKDLAGVRQVHLIASSAGGARVGGYAATHPDNVDRMVLVAPGHNRPTHRGQPRLRLEEGWADTLVTGPAFEIHTRAGYNREWEAQSKYEGQHDPAIIDVLWNLALEQDPKGARWVTAKTGGTGVVRSPTRTRRNWTDLAPKITAPTLIVVGELDFKWMVPGTLELYHALTVNDKAHILVERASHHIGHEAAHTVLHTVSKRWLLSGSR